MPKAPRASFAAESDAHTEVDPTEHLQAFLYLDYNDVLNSGRPDMLEAMCEFLVRVDHIPGDRHVTLLSKRKDEEDNSRRWKNSTVLECLTSSIALRSQASAQAVTTKG